MPMSYDEIVNLKVGDDVWECQLDECRNYVVTVEPTVECDGEFTQVSFSAKPTDSDLDCMFLLTKGMEHYGPKLYRYMAYMNFKSRG